MTDCQHPTHPALLQAVFLNFKMMGLEMSDTEMLKAQGRRSTKGLKIVGLLRRQLDRRFGQPFAAEPSENLSCYIPYHSP